MAILNTLMSSQEPDEEGMTNLVVFNGLIFNQKMNQRKEGRGNHEV